MRRAPLAMVLLGTLLSAGYADAAVTAITYQDVNACSSDVHGSMCLGVGRQDRLELEASSSSTSGCFDFYDATTNIQDTGCGAVTWSTDPMMRLFTLTGTVASNRGTITVDVTGIQTTIGSYSPVNYYRIDVDPLSQPPSANGYAYGTVGGHLFGTLRSSSGASYSIRDAYFTGSWQLYGWTL